MIELSQSVVVVEDFDPAVYRPLQLRVEGNRVEATLDGRVRTTAKLEGEAEVAGQCGLFITGNSPSRAPVKFRSLLVQPLPAAEPEVAQQPGPDADRLAVEAAIAAAEAQAVEDPEAAVLDLRSTLRRTRQLPQGSARSAWTEAIQRLLTKHDPIAKKRAKRLGKRAPAILAIARDHAGNDRILTAVAWLRLGRAFDDDTMSAAYRDFEVEFAEQFIAIRGLPPEPEQPVDLATLRTVFVGGQEEFTNGWSRGDTEWSAPAVPKQSAMLTSQKPLGASAEIQVQVRFEDPNDEAGLAFWIHSRRRFAVLTLIPARSGQSRVQINEWLGREWRPIGARTVHLSEDALRGWITLRLRYGPNSLEGGVLRTEPMRFRTEATTGGTPQPSSLPLPPLARANRVGSVCSRSTRNAPYTSATWSFAPGTEPARA